MGAHDRNERRECGATRGFRFVSAVAEHPWTQGDRKTTSMDSRLRGTDGCRRFRDPLIHNAHMHTEQEQARADLLLSQIESRHRPRIMSSCLRLIAGLSDAAPREGSGPRQTSGMPRVSADTSGREPGAGP